MRPPVRLAFAVLVAWCAPLWFGAPARADTSVASLGVRSLDGESDLERRLSTALRNSASAMESWSVAKRDTSLEQMMLAIGCDEPDAPCLGEVAKTLSVQLLVFGTVTNAGGGQELTLNQYDTADKQVHTASARGLKPAQLRGPGAREAVAALLAQLNAKEEPPPPVASTGQLRVEGGAPYARLSVDGQSMGNLDDRGALTLELPPGKHVVRAEDGSEEKLALVEAGHLVQLQLPGAPRRVEQPPTPVLPEPTLESTPDAPPKHNIRRAFGWVSLGFGAAFAVATIYSWVRIERINDDPDFLAYRSAFPRAGSTGGVGNVCPRAARGELTMEDPGRRGLERRANDLCGEADTLQAMQYVFLGGALVGAGVGTYLLVSARRMEKREAAGTSLSIAPRFGFQSASLEARLSF